MEQVGAQTFSKLAGRQAHAPQHPFDDVAVVAEQSSRLPAVMAVVGAYLPPLKAPLADGAPVALKGNESGNVFGSEAGPPFAEVGILPRPSHWVRAEPGILLFRAPPTFGAFAKLTSARGGFGRVAALLTSRFNLRALRVFATLSSPSIQVLEAILTAPFQVRGPSFWGAISFSHRINTTRRSPTLNRAVV